MNINLNLCALLHLTIIIHYNRKNSQEKLNFNEVCHANRLHYSTFHEVKVNKLILPN